MHSHLIRYNQVNLTMRNYFRRATVEEIRHMRKLLLGVLALMFGAANVASAETIRIAIGHQSKCTDTYSAGIILKELGLIQKYLPTDGKYKGVEYVFNWKDYSSGSPITNQMLANKLDIMMRSSRFSSPWGQAWRIASLCREYWINALILTCRLIRWGSTGW